MFRPLIFRPKTFNLRPPTRQEKREIFEKGDAPPPSQEQLQFFSKNRKAILESKLVPQLRKSRDVLHGAESRNTIVKQKIGQEEAKKQNLITRTYDYDVWSKMPRKRAVEIENEIDKEFGADVAQVEKLPVGKDAPDYQSSKKGKKIERYGVVTPLTPAGKQEVDYASFPVRSFATNTINGVRHETLKSSYRRAQEDKDRPIRSERAYREIRNAERLDRILRQRGKRGVLR